MTNVTSQVEAACSPKHRTEITYNEAFGVAIVPGTVSRSEITLHMWEYKVILERNSPFNHQKFPEIQQKNYKELWLQLKKGRR